MWTAAPNPVPITPTRTVSERTAPGRCRLVATINVTHTRYTRGLGALGERLSYHGG